MLGYFNNWNIIQFFNKSTTYEDFDEVHKVVLDGISENMSSLDHNVKYIAVDTVDTTFPSYSVARLIPELYTLQVNKIVNKQVINADELIVDARYLIMMKANTNWY